MGFDEMDVEQIWMDGEFVDWEDAQIHVLTHGLHYGTGVFEGVRAYDTERGPALFRWEDHLDRLYDSAKPYDIEIPYEPAELTAATTELLDREGLDSCYVRPIAFYGYDMLGVNPADAPVRVAIAAWPWGTYLGEEALEEGVDVGVSSWRKHASSQIPTNSKVTGAYINSVLASLEAERNGYVEAIVLNKEGNVAEGPGENIFLIEDGELYTADELFFSGTAAEVTPIRSVDDVEIGTGTKGPVTDELQAAFFDLVERRPPEHEEWFRPI